MRSKVKTGDVIQIRRNGPNYVSLGKVRDGEGQEFLVATRNGNLTLGGQMKASQPGRRPKIKLIRGDEVKRVHGSRPVDMESILQRTDARLRRHLQRTTGTTGIVTEAPNIAAQVAELVATF